MEGVETRLCRNEGMGPGPKEMKRDIPREGDRGRKRMVRGGLGTFEGKFSLAGECSV